jgi:hypothetical protein
MHSSKEIMNFDVSSRRDDAAFEKEQPSMDNRENGMHRVKNSCFYKQTN